MLLLIACWLISAEFSVCVCYLLILALMMLVRMSAHKCGNLVLQMEGVRIFEAHELQDEQVRSIINITNAATTFDANSTRY